MKDDSEIQSRLTTIIEKLLTEERSYYNLSLAISKANRNNRTVDRRKLKRLVEPKVGAPKVTFTLDELEALDMYLGTKHHGLAHVFERADLLDSLAHFDHVTFVVGSRSRENRTDINAWDVRTISSLMSSLTSIRPGMEFGIEEDMFDRKVRTVNPRMRALLTKEGQAIACIGAPHASNVSEFLLSRMFGTKPFASHDPQRHDLPFVFVNTDPEPLESAFVINADELPKRDQRAVEELRKKGVWGLRTRDELRPTNLSDDKRSHDLYGVIVAQQRDRLVWSVFAGTSGPLTLSSVFAAGLWKEPLFRGKPGEPGPVMYAVVKGTVTQDPQKPVDPRTVPAVEFVVPPQVWTGSGSSELG